MVDADAWKRVDYNSEEYQSYLREERARRKAGLAATPFTPKLVSDVQDEPSPEPDPVETHRFYQYTYRDSGGSG